MKIDTLKLTAFRSHRNTELSLARINIVKGRNAAGKSSLQMAIEYALTGRCALTDGAGRGAEALIQHGAQQFAVELTMSHGATIQASHSKADGTLIVIDHATHPAAGKQAQKWIEDWYGPLPVLSAVLNAGRFLEMSATEQKALLANALASEPVSMDAEILKLGAGVIPGLLSKVDSATVVDGLHKQCYDLRTQVNRDLKHLGVLTAPEIPADMPNAATVSERITKITSERNQVVAQRAKKMAEYEAARQQGERSAERRRHLDTQRRQTEGETIATSEDLAKLQKLAARAKEAAQLDAGIAELQRKVNSGYDMVTSLKGAQQAKDCPTCGRPMEGQDNRAAIAQMEEKELPQLQEQLKAAQTTRMKLGDPATAAERLERHRQAMERLGEIHAELETLAPSAAVDPPDLTAEDGSIRALDKRLAKGREVEQQVLKLEGAKKHYDETARLKQVLATKAEALERLVEYFGDKGPLKAALVGGRMPAFRERINQVLERFGFSCAFELEPYLLQVQTIDGAHLRDLRQLSESEAYRFGIAFQIALAEATNVRLVIIDRADILQPDARRFLTEALMASELAQAIVLVTGEPTGEYPEIRDVKFIELVNREGQSRVLTQSATAARETVYEAVP